MSEPSTELSDARRVLAVELSTARGSLALFGDAGRLVARRDWTEQRRTNRPAFAALREALAEADWPADALDGFAVGRGPGIYSGMRVAFMLARSLALPHGRPVHAVSSGRALAAALAETEPEERLAVLGDARRGQYWLGRFRREPDGSVSVESDWTLHLPGDLPAALPPGTVVATSEWARIAPLVRGRAWPGVRWVEGDRYPDAEHVGRLARAAADRGEPSEPLAPLYLHPAVAPRGGE